MKLFLLVIITAYLSGCTMFDGAKIESKWSVLQNVEAVSCDSWPLRVRDIGITGIKPVIKADGSFEGFLASVVDRKGASNHYYAAFDGSTSLDEDDFDSLDFGASSVVVGGIVDDQPMAGILVASASKPRFEFRNIANNVIKHSASISDEPFIEGELSLASKGGWIGMRTPNDQLKIAHMVTGTGKFDLKMVGGLFEDVQIIHRESDGAALTVWQVGADQFKVRQVAANGDKSKTFRIPLSIEDQIESWTAIGYASGFYLVYTDGDSLIGQTSLKVSFFRWEGDAGPIVSWTKSIAVNDTHMNKPIARIVRGQLNVLMTNWVDAESTIARYKISGEQLAFDRYYGVFKQGAQIQSLFQEEPQGALFALIREKTSSRWAYKLCEF